MEIADTGVGVLSVCPGPVETPFRNSMFGNSLSKVVVYDVVKCLYLSKDVRFLPWQYIF